MVSFSHRPNKQFDSSKIEVQDLKDENELFRGAILKSRGGTDASLSKAERCKTLGQLGDGKAEYLKWSVIHYV